MKTVIKTAASLVLAACTLNAPAFAHEQGELFARVGLASVMPNESSDNVLNTGELEIDNNTQLGLTLTYMYTENFGIELLAATPFTHEVSTAGLGKVAEVTHLPPSVLAQYYFGQANDAVRPYVGAGINYTVFFDEKGYGALDGTDVSLDNSFGYALQAGVDYKIDDNWGVNAAVWYINIETDVETAVGTIETKINPTVAMASLIYKF